MRKFLAINCCIWRFPDETYFQIGGGWGGGGGIVSSIGHLKHHIVFF